MLENKKAKTAARIFERLREATPDPRCELDYVNPFTLLVAIVLSAQATDKGVNKATPALFAAADTPEKMLALGEEKVNDYIKTINFHNNKARSVIAMSRAIVREFGGIIPNDGDGLQKLPGVGRKTANVFLNVAYGAPTIGVDTHVMRLSNRLGLAKGDSPAEIEEQLERVVPAKFKPLANHLLVLHGRYVCTARGPKCGQCVIAGLCPSRTR